MIVHQNRTQKNLRAMTHRMEKSIPLLSNAMERLTVKEHTLQCREQILELLREAAETLMTQNLFMVEKKATPVPRVLSLIQMRMRRETLSVSLRSERKN